MKKILSGLTASLMLFTLMSCAGDSKDSSAALALLATMDETPANVVNSDKKCFVVTDSKRSEMTYSKADNGYKFVYLPSSAEESTYNFTIVEDTDSMGGSITLGNSSVIQKDGAKISIPVNKDHFYKFIYNAENDSLNVTELESLPVTTTFIISGSKFKTGDLVWFNGTPWGDSWPNGWPFASWNSGSETKTQVAMDNVDKYGRYLMADGKTEPINVVNNYAPKKQVIYNFKFVQCTNLDFSALDDKGNDVFGWLPGIGDGFANGTVTIDSIDGTFDHITVFVDMSEKTFDIKEIKKDFSEVVEVAGDSETIKNNLDGTIAAVISADKDGFKPSEKIIISGLNSKFQLVSGTKKVFNWDVKHLETGNAVTFTISKDGSTIIIPAEEFGQYQISLMIQQKKGDVTLNSLKVKRTVCRIEDDYVCVRARVKLIDDSDVCFLAHTGGYILETGNPIDLRKESGSDWAPYATQLTEKDSNGNFMYKDAEGYFYRDFIVPAAENFEVQPTRGTWGSKARKGQYYDTFDYTFKPTYGSVEKPYVVSLEEVTNGTETSNAFEFHWGNTKGTGDYTTQNIPRDPLLVFGENATSYKLIWNTSASTVTWGAKDDETGTAGTVVSGTVEGKTSGYECVFDNLEAGKEYWYKVGDGEKVNFKAPVADGNEFRYVIVTDHQSENDYSNQGFKFTVAENPDFYISNGDVTNEGYALSEWKSRFFDLMIKYVGPSGKIFSAAPGNHDGISSLFQDYMGQKARYHRFEYGGVSFYTLDVESAYTRGSKQYQWLEENLKNDPNSFKIVALHESPYCAGPRHYSNMLVRQELVPLFEKYGVDFVQAGHQHIFNITEIVNNIQYATFPCLGAGVATGDVKDEPFEKETILGYYGYAVVDVKNASEAKVTVYGYTKNEATSSAEVAEESKIVLYTFNVTDANK